MRVVAALALLALVPACGGSDRAARPAEARPQAGGDAYEVIDEHGEPLRSAFAADRGDVRAIFLVSPT